MDWKRWRVPMSFMMVGVGIANGQGAETATAGACYECAWFSDECVTAPDGDWGSTSCVGEAQGFEECTLSERGCTGGQVDAAVAGVAPRSTN
jgi:hypothetical protein